MLESYLKIKKSCVCKEKVNGHKRIEIKGLSSASQWQRGCAVGRGAEPGSHLADSPWGFIRGSRTSLPLYSTQPLLKSFRKKIRPLAGLTRLYNLTLPYSELMLVLHQHEKPFWKNKLSHYISHELLSYHKSLNST